MSPWPVRVGATSHKRQTSSTCWSRIPKVPLPDAPLPAPTDFQFGDRVFVPADKTTRSLTLIGIALLGAGWLLPHVVYANSGGTRSYLSTKYIVAWPFVWLSLYAAAKLAIIATVGMRHRSIRHPARASGILGGIALVELMNVLSTVVPFAAVPGIDAGVGAALWAVGSVVLLAASARLATSTRYQGHHGMTRLVALTLGLFLISYGFWGYFELPRPDVPYSPLELFVNRLRWGPASNEFWFVAELIVITTVITLSLLRHSARIGAVGAWASMGVVASLTGAALARALYWLGNPFGAPPGAAVMPNAAVCAIGSAALLLFVAAGNKARTRTESLRRVQT
jgi:hypothetical protein